jgi:hypothetical protein
MRSSVKYLLIALLSGIVIYGCERFELYEASDARLGFSTDSVLFDTVFTTIGSATREVKIYNTYDQPLEIGLIALAGGDQSVFRLNIDGLATHTARGIEIPPNDSIYIFVEVTLDPNNQDSILLIQDSILFNTNGNIQDIDLVAWGQDVHIFRADTIQTGIWINDKPYLIIDYLMIDSFHTLSIQEGVRIHLHKDAWLVVKGTLKVRGTLDNPVIIQGDRLEYLYEDIPGQWGRIWFWPGMSRDNHLQHVTIKNGMVGIHADSMVNSQEPTVTLENCRIQNMSAAGILASGTHIEANNTVIGNCGQFNLFLRWGGEYAFKHCTFANYWHTFSNRNTPGVGSVNYYKAQNGSIQVREFDGINFGNCIIYGNREFEFIVDDFPGTETPYIFDHCLLKLDQGEFDLSDENHFKAVINGKDPRFMDVDKNDYRLDTLSPAKDMALFDISLLFPTDLAGEDRLADGLPDIGAFERIETTARK